MISGVVTYVPNDTTDSELVVFARTDRTHNHKSVQKVTVVNAPGGVTFVDAVLAGSKKTSYVIKDGMYLELKNMRILGT